jgi:GNAT superfamily N-acetyltransferase
VRAPTIRRATATDVSALAVLNHAWHEDGREDPRELTDDYRRQFTDWYVDQCDSRLVWLAVLDGTAVGFVDVEVRTSPPRPRRPSIAWGYIESAYVRPEHRNLGIGRELLNAVLADADERALGAVFLHPTQDAVSLYERAGFAQAPPEKPRMVRFGPRRPNPESEPGSQP